MIDARIQDVINERRFLRVKTNIKIKAHGFGVKKFYAGKEQLHDYCDVCRALQEARADISSYTQRLSSLRRKLKRLHIRPTPIEREEKQKESHRRWRKKHPNYQKKYMKKYREKRPGYQQEYYDKHRARIRAKQHDGYLQRKARGYYDKPV
jgi:Skp family chaperone for outer membrane proteins